MKVLHVQETLSPKYGGPATVLRQLVVAQDAQGIDVEVLTTNADHPSGQYCDAGRRFLAGSNVPVTYCGVEIGALRFSMGLAKFLHQNVRRFDVVHIHGLYRFPQTYAAYCCRRAGVPYIIRPHGSLDPYLYARSSRGLWLKRIYERFFVLPNLNAAGAIHFTSEDERQRVEFLGLRPPSFVISNGLEWAPYVNLPSRGAVRRRFELGDGPLVLFLGRLHFKKGLDILIEAFDAVRQKVHGARLLIVGPEADSYGDEVRGWVAQRGLESCVTFSGPLEGSDVVQAYVDADVFALPSYTENFGMTVAEAMASGTAVAISDQVNIHAEVTDANAGMVTRCDAGEFSTALVTLLSDADLRQRLGTGGRRLVLDKFSWPNIVRMLTIEYQHVIDRHI